MLGGTVCQDRRSGWVRRVGKQGGNCRGLFSKWSPTIRRTFGLTAVIIRTVREGYGDNPNSTTLGYLALPGTSVVDDMKHGTVGEYGFGGGTGSSEIALPCHISMPGPLSEESRKKFKNAMRVLRLEPFVVAETVKLLASQEDRAREHAAAEDGVDAKNARRVTRSRSGQS